VRIWPRSLLGQVLLAVAVALLVAQAISAVLLFRAGEDRRDQRLVGSLAVQLIAGSSGGGRPNGHDRMMRRFRAEVAQQPPASPFDRDEPRLTAALAAVLAEQGLPSAGKVRVVSRPAMRDPRVLARIADGRPVHRDVDLAGARITIASVPRAEGNWLTARAFAPPADPHAFQALVVQTLVLFGALLLAMWLLLRRITRPLAAMTRRVEEFARTYSADGQLEPQGPDDVRRLIAAHNAMESRISAMLDEKDVMLGAIGHDLKTPLAALRVRIESVEDDAERGRMAATIEDITRTLDDILSLARVGRATEPPERTELAALAASVVEEFEDMGDSVTLAEGQRVVAPVHVTWAKRALRNLVANAVRYGGGAEVEVMRDGREAVLRVTDSGPGIPEGSLAAMTEPFTRGEASRNRGTGGAGLGLTLARAIAEAHGGRLVLANRSEGGLSAELRLPLA
jgi:signal transduction histidine kinase